MDFSVYDLAPIYENFLTKVNSLNNLRYEQIFIKNILEFIPSEWKKNWLIV